MINKKYQPIWQEVEPLMKKVKKKDYILHVKMVVRAMQEILTDEGGDPDILIPAAILHDVGWSKVPEKFQLAESKKDKRRAEVLHIQEAPPIIKKILGRFGFDEERIKKIIDIILAHKFTEPKEKEKKLLIDADTLSDTYKESFYSDVKSYRSTPRKAWEFRSKNIFYTKTARRIFEKQLIARQKEIIANEEEKISNKEDRKIIKGYQKRFLSQPSFPPLKSLHGKKPRENLDTFRYTSYLIFVRAKFLFLALNDQIEKKNAFAAFSLLKSYWETVAILGYLVITGKRLIGEGNLGKLASLSHKLVMGGKKYPTEEMLKKRGLPKEDYIQPNVLTMMQKIDKDWNKKFKSAGLKPISGFEEEYNKSIAESGHPTFLGMIISGVFLSNGSLLPDINQSWNKRGESSILNYTVLASLIFFEYWDRFLEIK